jgi:hypothetical protein
MCALTMLCGAVALCLPSQAAAAVPQGFFGVVSQGPLSATDFARMRGVVGTLRIPFYWFEIEPHPGHFDFSSVDEEVGEAADLGIRVLPFVYGSPAWLSREPAFPPQGSARGRIAWARFLRVLVHRYGPRGRFWRRRARRMPIRRWQIWNEPNFLLFWRPRPAPAGYARLLRIAARALRGADRGARIVTAGVAPVRSGMLPWAFLHRLYAAPGVKRSFDEVGLHPYASSLYSLAFQIVQARAAMLSARDGRTPLAITELGVASGGPASSMVKTPAGQAAFLRRAYGLLLRRQRRWRIAGVDWYSWQDGPEDPHCVFCQHAGLFDLEGDAKPAWRAFRRLSSRAGS